MASAAESHVADRTKLTAWLIVQFFVFDAEPYLKSAFLKVGYHGLTVVLMYHAVVYSLAAFLPRS